MPAILLSTCTDLKVERHIGSGCYLLAITADLDTNKHSNRIFYKNWTYDTPINGSESLENISLIFKLIFLFFYRRFPNLAFTNFDNFICNVLEIYATFLDELCKWFHKDVSQLSIPKARRTLKFLSTPDIVATLPPRSPSSWWSRKGMANLPHSVNVSILEPTSLSFVTISFDPVNPVTG